MGIVGGMRGFIMSMLMRACGASEIRGLIPLDSPVAPEAAETDDIRVSFERLQTSINLLVLISAGVLVILVLVTCWYGRQARRVEEEGSYERVRDEETGATERGARIRGKDAELEDRQSQRGGTLTHRELAIENLQPGHSLPCQP